VSKTTAAGLMTRYKNYCLQGLGLGFVGLGVIGIALPVVPTTIFFILALACFTHSSQRLEEWLLNHARFGPILHNWQSHKVVPHKAKWLAAIGMSIGLYFMMHSSAPTWAVAIVAVIEALVLAYLAYCPSYPQQPAHRARAIIAVVSAMLLLGGCCLMAWLMNKF
tara:strand:+ start:34260 stop:34754 length:495 start_codon:yes stop_codon:yes gene_type:complete